MSLFFLYLIFVNLLGFFLFGIDKYKAIHKKWRIRESLLFAVSLAGGSVGSLCGMYLFHHKTKHKTFTIGIPLILVIQLGVYVATRYFL